MLAVMADLWLISVPLDKTSSSSVEQLKLSIAKTNQGSCCKFSIPDLKVGVLDSLLSTSENLFRLDTLTESVIKKTRQCIKDVMGQSPDNMVQKTSVSRDHNIEKKVVVSPLKAYLQSVRAEMMSCVTRFQWDKAKYPTALPLSSLVDIINKDVSQVETELTSRAAAYSSLNTSLQSLECKLDGGLLTRSLNGIIRKEDLVVSEYLTTVLVVVSRGSYLQWEKTYESLSEFVVPRSSRKLYEDGEGGIFSVTLFKRAVFDFKAKAQEKRFTLREYSFDLEEEKLQERKQLSVYKNEQYGTFVRWLKVNYSEMFTTWIHLKALRVFVESVLRYGLPVRYQALLLHTDSKSSRKVKEELASLFRHLDPTANVKSNKSDICDIPGLCQQEYFSYVCFDINTKVLEITEQSASVRGTHCSIKQ